MSLHVSEVFLARFRREVLAFRERCHASADGRPAPVPLPETARAWFMGTGGERDADIVARVARTAWWLEAACLVGRHRIEARLGADLFRYAASRFAVPADEAAAHAALRPVVRALAELFACPCCWPSFVHEGSDGWARNADWASRP